MPKQKTVYEFEMLKEIIKTSEVPEEKLNKLVMAYKTWKITVSINQKLEALKKEVNIAEASEIFTEKIIDSFNKKIQSMSRLIVNYRNRAKRKIDKYKELRKKKQMKLK